MREQPRHRFVGELPADHYGGDAVDGAGFAVERAARALAVDVPRAGSADTGRQPRITANGPRG